MKTYQVTMCDGYHIEVVASGPDSALAKAAEEAHARISEWPMTSRSSREALTIRSLELIEA